jgi:transposase
MSEVTTIGLDIAKAVFHAHGADATARIKCQRLNQRGPRLCNLAASCQPQPKKFISSVAYR